MKSDEEIVEAYDLTGSRRGAAELAGCSHHGRALCRGAGGGSVGAGRRDEEDGRFEAIQGLVELTGGLDAVRTISARLLSSSPRGSSSARMTETPASRPPDPSNANGSPRTGRAPAHRHEGGRSVALPSTHADVATRTR